MDHWGGRIGRRGGQDLRLWPGIKSVGGVVLRGRRGLTPLYLFASFERVMGLGGTPLLAMEAVAGMVSDIASC